ncbi:MAG TPA: glycosyltransferase family 39 protein [Desulfatiglandales bacterium]|nr:glycosyltransferase family 39 protein [Desulfatiglandales bacterium]
MPNTSNSKKAEIHFALNYIRASLVALLVILIVCIIILACVPPVSRDALVHHLTIPKLYLKHGGMYEIPSFVFSYYPMNLDLLYLVPLYFGNDIVPKFIHFCFALLTAWLIYRYLKRRTSITYALLGVVVFLSIPIIIKLSITVYVDLGLIFFSTASLLLVLKWLEDGLRLRILLLSALFCGLAAGTKYNGLITLILVTLFIPFLYSRYVPDSKPGFFKAAGFGVFFLCVALLVFSPWMMRNYLWTNNPFYPLYDHLFNPHNELNRQTIGLFAYRSLVYHETWWQMLLLPVRVFFLGQDGNPQYFDGRLNPFLLLLPIFAFCRIKDDPPVLRGEKKVFLAYAMLFFATAFFSSGVRIRYLSPIIPPLVILSILGVKKTVDSVSGLTYRYSRTIGFAVVFLVVSFALSLNAHYIFSQYGYVNPFGYLSGAVSRDRYIETYRREYPVLRYINENLHHDSKILFIHIGERGYYCDREYILDMNFNRSTLHEIVRKSKGSEDILQGITSLGITHLLIRYDIFDRWVRSTFTSREQESLRTFFKGHVRPLFFKWDYGISQIEQSPI